MALEILMPPLGVARPSARLVRWLRREGDLVGPGEPLATVEADRAIVEVLSPGVGVLSAVRVRQGESAPAGAVLAYLLAPATRPQSERLDGLPPAPQPAAELPAGASAFRPLSGIWRAMAQSAARSWRRVPHLFVLREVDAHALVTAAAAQPAGVASVDLLLRLLALTLTRHPRLNGSRREVNIGLMVALDAGTVVPVIANVQQLDVVALAARREALVDRARSGRLRPDDLAGGTFTLCDLGAEGVDAHLPIVSEGQTGTLGVGRLVERVVPVAGRPLVRPVLTLGLSCDQLVVDAVRAARFLRDLAEVLEHPDQLL